MRGFLITISFLLLCGCVSFVEKTGQILDGSAFKEKTVERYVSSNMEIEVVENNSYAKSLIITINEYPMIKFRASYPEEGDSFYFTGLEYLAGGIHGWSEYFMEMMGTGSVVFNTNAVFSADNEIEKVEITSGRIHRYSARVTGNEALTALRNRRERIEAIVEWMQSIYTPEVQSIKDFENYWKPVFFPELVSRKKRPEGWRQEGDVFQNTDDINWNTSYTERVFPEELVPVRNSGTLLRDWEEALSWLYIEYKWENIIEQLSQETVLSPAK